MACCMSAPSHCLNQCWRTISNLQWISSEGTFERISIHYPSMPKCFLCPSDKQPLVLPMAWQATNDLSSLMPICITKYQEPETQYFHQHCIMKQHLQQGSCNTVGFTCTWFLQRYHQISNIRRTLIGNKLVDHSDVVGASPVGAAPTKSSFLI